MHGIKQSSSAAEIRVSEVQFGLFPYKILAVRNASNYGKYMRKQYETLF